MQNKDIQEADADLRSDAKKAIWTFSILNICVVLLALIGDPDFVFLALIFQSLLIVFWLLPVFLYQVFVKKQALTLSVLKALASYKNIMVQMQWPS